MVVPADDVVVHEESGEAFLLNVADGRYYALNPTGLVVWQALQDGVDPITAVQDQWPEAPDDLVRSDVDRLLNELLTAGLVRAAGESQG